MIVYLIRNKLNGTVYVGQTTKTMERRWNTHWDNRNGKLVIDRAIKKYGRENFEIRHLANAANQEQLDYLESLFIVLFDSYDSEAGYNLLSGGNGGSGRKATEATKKKLSAWQKGKKLSESHRAALSIAQKKRFEKGFPEEVKKKQSAALRGRPWTEQRYEAFLARKRVKQPELFQ